MTTETQTRIEVCCDTACENYNVQQVIELTPEEIAQREADAIAARAYRAEQEAAAEALAAAKASAQAKLSELGLSADEIAALSK